VKRREFITLLGGAAAWPLAAKAQQPAKTFRIGITTIQPRTAPIYAVFDQRLRELGYIEGQNLIVDFLNPEDQTGGIAGAIKELVRRKVDVIVAPYESALKSALAVTGTVPIVMIAIDYDPLALGYIQSLSPLAQAEHRCNFVPKSEIRQALSVAIKRGRDRHKSAAMTRRCLC